MISLLKPIFIIHKDYLISLLLPLFHYLYSQQFASLGSDSHPLRNDSGAAKFRSVARSILR